MRATDSGTPMDDHARTEECLTIQPKEQPDLTLPMPYHVLLDGTIGRQDAWQGDPAALLGFQHDPTVQHVDLLREAFVRTPQRAVGMYPVFVRDNGEIYVLTIPVESVTPGRCTR